MKPSKLPPLHHLLFLSVMLFLITGLGVRFFKYLTWGNVFFNLQYQTPINSQVKIHLAYQDLFGIMHDSDITTSINPSNGQLKVKLPAGTRNIHFLYTLTQSIHLEKAWLSQGGRTINYALNDNPVNQEFTGIDTNAEYFYNRILRFQDYYYYFGLITVFVIFAWSMIRKQPRPIFMLLVILLLAGELFHHLNLIPFLRPTGYTQSGIIAYLQYSDTAFLSDLINIILMILLPGLSLLFIIG